MKVIKIGAASAACLLILSATIALAQRPTKEVPRQDRPNIIFLLTDDQRADALGAMGNPIIHTPHLDTMAHEGYLFRNAYVTTSICAVSRASLLSGQYMARHGIADFKTDFTEEALANTYPLLLQQAGYRIGFIGKYGVGNHPPGDRFDFWSVWERGQPPYWLKDGSGKDVHHTDSVDRDIARFLDEYGHSNQPFCLSVSFKAPHELDGDPPVYQVQQRFDTLYSGVDIPPQANGGEDAWQRTPPFFHDEASIARKRWEGLFGTPEQYQTNVKNYYRLVTGVDEVVGHLRAKLKELHIDDRTVIIFMGDNGFMLGNHGLEGKWFGYEESVRVPLIVYDPRKPADAPSVVQDIALNIDIAPTILGYAQVAVPAAMQGSDLQQAALQRGSTRTDFFYEHTFMGSPGIPQVEGVVGGRYKYLVYTEHDYEELFDLEHDPHELNNLATDGAYARRLKEMQKRYQALKTAAQ
ncbi:sulfatase family protein [Parapedobacter sp. DT-150]|uniref:sulfatase family protein n=1 Tax=Parapedobacter sp. DT-150 TaxID=3396162 RepID=UPI003F1DA5D1